MIEVLLLAGGKGERVKDFWDGPKCLMPISGISFIDYLLNNLFSFHKIISIGHKGDQVKKHLKYTEYKDLEFVEDKILDGTFNAVREASKKINSEDFIIMNADTILDLTEERLEEFYNEHVDSGKDISIALKRINKNVGNFMKQDDNELWTHYRKDGEEYLITGIYCIKKSILKDYYKFSGGSFEKILPFHSKNIKIFDEFFIDIGSEEEYRANNYFHDKKEEIIERSWRNFE